MIVTAYTLRVGQVVRPSSEPAVPFRTVASIQRIPGRVHNYAVTFTDGSRNVAGRHLVWDEGH